MGAVGDTGRPRMWLKTAVPSDGKGSRRPLEVKAHTWLLHGIWRLGTQWCVLES